MEIEPKIEGAWTTRRGCFREAFFFLFRGTWARVLDVFSLSECYTRKHIFLIAELYKLNFYIWKKPQSGRRLGEGFFFWAAAVL